MKLWIKISLLTGIVMTLAMGVFGGFLIYETGQNNVKQTVENSLQQLQTTAVGVGRELEGNHLRQYSQEGRKAYSKYLLKRYGGKEYLLLKDGVVLCNLTNYDLLP